MSWQVIQYMDENPQAKPKDIIAHYAEALEVDEQIKFLLNEVGSVLLLRERLRPLYGKRMHAEQEMTLLNSQFDMDVMLKYPPRKGTEKERKAYKLELQNNDTAYQEHQKVINEVKDEIEEIEEQLYEVQAKAKNARRITETFNNYVNFILSFSNGQSSSIQVNDDEQRNHNVF